jgi:hypothetical protein
MHHRTRAGVSGSDLHADGRARGTPYPARPTKITRSASSTMTRLGIVHTGGATPN